ncbi:MAG: hypothetical protein EOO54_15320 [Haliea sp.]|nr:MAG: hypothetical protein EOO54_15320 [Haliea sp.]
MTVLTSVPWGDVVSNAPKIAAGAKKLWKAVGSKPADTADSVDAVQSHTGLPAEPGSLADLRARLDAMEAMCNGLHAQMVESSELIKALAEQNTQLVMRIEKMRRRIVWLGIAVGVTALSMGAWALRG